MKTNLIITGLLAFIISSCSSPKYLSTSDKIDVNQYGSYIVISDQKSHKKIKGELISIDSSRLIVLTESKKSQTKKSVIVPIKEIRRFTLLYARPKHYGSTIPLYSIASIGLGLFRVFATPINLVATSLITLSGENAFRYYKKDITFETLKMFARYPQGIPQNIDLASIK